MEMQTWVASAPSLAEGHRPTDECAVLQATLTGSAMPCQHQQKGTARFYCPLEIEYISVTRTIYYECKQCKKSKGTERDMESVRESLSMTSAEAKGFVIFIRDY